MFLGLVSSISLNIFIYSDTFLGPNCENSKRKVKFNFGEISCNICEARVKYTLMFLVSLYFWALSAEELFFSTIHFRFCHVLWNTWNLLHVKIWKSTLQNLMLGRYMWTMSTIFFHLQKCTFRHSCIFL